MNTRLRCVFWAGLWLLAACATRTPVSLPHAIDEPPAAIVQALPAPTPESTPAAGAAGSPSSDRSSADHVLERLRVALAPLDCSQQPIERAVHALLDSPAAFVAKLERVLPLFDYVLAEVERRRLPGQFALIPWAESGFRADPGNRGAVQGLWQFTAATGRSAGLRIDAAYDGRRAAIESTTAALTHLAGLMQRFGDWQLALFAYNAGEARLRRALTAPRLGASGLPSGMPRSSYAYLRKIEALACVLTKPDRHRLVLPEAHFERLAVAGRPAAAYRVDQLAAAAGLEPTALLAYNAAFRGGLIAADAPKPVLLPATAATRLASLPPAAQDAATEPSGRTHTVVAGDSLWRIARRYRLALPDLLRWNGLSKDSVLRPGQRIRLAP